MQEAAIYKNILIPTDGSELAGKAVTDGIALAKALGAKITVLTITQPFRVFALDPAMVEDTTGSYEMHAKQHADTVLSAVSAAATQAGVVSDTVHIEHDHPYEGIIHTAKQRGCDLIMMASHGRRGVSALVLGSETVKVLTHTRIPVLVCR